MGAVGISVVIDSEFKKVVSSGWLRKTARTVLIAEEASHRTDMGLVLTGQGQIQALNMRYLGEDRPTDVLSFPMTDGAVPARSPDGARQLGEVIISYPQALKQAQRRGHPVDRELALLIVHGTLHLLGYDHDIPSRKKQMRVREAAIRKDIEEGVL